MIFCLLYGFVSEFYLTASGDCDLARCLSILVLLVCTWGGLSLWESLASSSESRQQAQLLKATGQGLYRDSTAGSRLAIKGSKLRQGQDAKTAPREH